MLGVLQSVGCIRRQLIIFATVGCIRRQHISVGSLQIRRQHISAGSVGCIGGSIFVLGLW